MLSQAAWSSMDQSRVFFDSDGPCVSLESDRPCWLEIGPSLELAPLVILQSSEDATKLTKDGLVSLHSE